MDIEIQALLDAIKRDDVVTFASIVTKKGRYLSLCFGRMPVLSLCYLYKSKKINKEFGGSLAKINNFLRVEEDYDSYKRFRTYAKTCLRLYVFEDVIVYPLEMLAIMGDIVYLKEMYPRAYKNTKIIDNIQTVLVTLYGHKSQLTDNRIQVFGNNKLSLMQKVSIIAVSIIFVLMIVLSSTMWGILPIIKGEGTRDNPLKIKGENQLIEAMERDLHCELVKDIVLTKQWTPLDFAGHIKGNGNKIIASDLVQEGFIHELTGSLEDIVFVVNNLQLELDRSLSFFVDFNEGNISNISLSVEAKFSQSEQVENAIYLSLLNLENYNEIKDCDVTMDIKFEGKGIVDAYFSAITAINKGLVFRCSTTKGSTIVTDTVDIGGIVVINDSDGWVDECVNNATITQTTEKDYWFPQIGGVVMVNFGTLDNCINKGNIHAHSGAEQWDIELYIGGVVSINNNIINQSKNNANIEVTATKFHIYLGGIASFNNVPYAKINNCSSYGTLSAESKGEDAYVFVGGIAGCSLGTIEDSYAYIEAISNNKNAFLGGIMGSVFPSAASINNYYVDYEKIEFGIASRMYDYFEQRIIEGATSEWGDSGVTKVESYESLRELEVYWE